MTGCSRTAASATPPSAEAALETVAVAYSGGRDSTALLHATLAAAAPIGVRVVALHVHHGLSANADAWLKHAAAQCRRWSRYGDLSFASTRLASKPRAGDSVEAWARRARYGALRDMALAGGADLVLLGHHRRDQAETFLLQALRSGGVAALSAMPRSARRDGVTWARPWLDVPAAAVEAYARRHRLRWIDDDSNADTRFARNRLRADVWPALVAAFPDCEQTLATAAHRSQQAAAAIAEVADLDLASIADAGELSIAAWRELSPTHRGPALLAWLRIRTREAMPGSLIERLEAELDGTAKRRWPVPGGELGSYRGRLRWLPAPGPVPPTAPVRCDLSRPGTHDCPAWHGTFQVERVELGGISEAHAARLTLRRRAAGDRFQAGPGRPPRSLKLQFQAAGIAEEARHGPVACLDDKIVFVAGLGIDARACAEPGQSQFAITWLPAPEADETAR